MDATHVELLERFQRAQAQLTDRIDAVGTAQWDLVALPGRTVAELVARLIADQLRVPLLLTGAAVGHLPGETEELLGGDPLGSWEAAADQALTAWAGAADLASPIGPPAANRSAAEHLAEQTVALTVHAWDLARATGGDTRLDHELVAAALGWAELRPGAPGATGCKEPAPVPADADPQRRMLGLFGRRS